MVLRKLNQITELMRLTKQRTNKQTMLHARVFHLIWRRQLVYKKFQDLEQNLRQKTYFSYELLDFYQRREVLRNPDTSHR